MTHKERVKAAIAFQKTDRIPVGPYMANHCCVAMGYRLKDCYTNARNLADAQFRAWQLYRQDIITIQSDGYYIPEGFGCIIHKPEYANHTPSMIKPALESLSDIGRLPRLDPHRDGRMPVYIDAMRMLKDMVKNEVCLRACGIGPFTLASHLLGTEAFLMEAAMAVMDEDKEKEEQLTDLIQLCTDTVVDFSHAMLDAGADIVQCGDSLASLDMISPEIYRRFAYPFEKQYFERMKEPCRQYGAHRLLHICGCNEKIYDDFKTLDMDLIEIDSKVSLAFARAQLGDRHIAMIGNLDPVAVIMQGVPEQIREVSWKAIRDSGGDGFILGSGCEVPVFTPGENIKAMVDAASEFSNS